MADFLERVDAAKASHIAFRLWVERWDQYQPLCDLTWSAFAFSEDSLAQIPQDAGVYAFCIEPAFGTSLFTSYLIYVGETRRTFKQRFREYLREEGSEVGRALIRYYLGKYAGHIRYYCAAVPDGVDPRDVERELLNAYLPICNPSLPAEVRDVAKAAF